MTLARDEVGPASERAAGWAVEAENLRYLHPSERGLRSLDLRVSRGAIFGLLGPNGSGKSTFVLLIAGLLSPQGGSLRVLGRTILDLDRARLGWVFQEQSLDPLLTVRETLVLSSRLYAHQRGDIEATAESFALADRLDDRAGELSGGLRRRLELARSVQHKPELLLLDEPTLALDIDSRKAFWEQLRRLNDEGLTVLVATNDIGEAEEYCSEVAFIRDGAKVTQGAPADLRAGLRPQSVQLRWPGLSDGDFAALSKTEGVATAARAGEVIRLTAPDARDVLSRLLTLESGRLESIEISQSSLEDAYFQITGSLLRGSSPQDSN